MPQVKLRNVNNFLICPDIGVEGYIQEVAESIGQQCLNSIDCDVRIHCSDRITLATSRQILSQGSLLFRNIFTSNCQCSSYIPVVYDVLCPNFSSSMVEKVLELVRTGQATFDSLRNYQVQELKSVIETLKISVPFLIDDSCQISEDVELVDLDSGDETSEAAPDGECLELESDDDSDIEETFSRVMDPKLKSEYIREEPNNGVRHISGSLSSTNDFEGFETEDETHGNNLPSRSLPQPSHHQYNYSISEPTTEDNPNAIVNFSEQELLSDNDGEDNQLELPDATTGENGQQTGPQGMNQLIPQILPAQYIKKEDPSSENLNGKQYLSLRAKSFETSEVFSRDEGDAKVRQCKYCDMRFLRKGTLICHYAGVHFRKQIEQMKLISTKGKRNRCNLCRKMFFSKYRLLGHLLAKHDCVKDLMLSSTNDTTSLGGSSSQAVGSAQHTSMGALPPEKRFNETELQNASCLQNHIPTNSNPIENNTDNVEQSSQGNTSDNTTAKETCDSTFHCILCDAQFNRRELIIFHYSNVHYRERLVEMNLNNKNQCKICKYKAPTIPQVFHHLAAKHRCLKEYIPKDLRKRSTGQDSQIPMHVKDEICLEKYDTVRTELNPNS